MSTPASAMTVGGQMEVTLWFAKANESPALDVSKYTAHTIASRTGYPYRASTRLDQGGLCVKLVNAPAPIGSTQRTGSLITLDTKSTGLDPARAAWTPVRSSSPDRLRPRCGQDHEHQGLRGTPAQGSGMLARFVGGGGSENCVAGRG